MKPSNIHNSLSSREDTKNLSQNRLRRKNPQQHGKFLSYCGSMLICYRYTEDQVELTTQLQPKPCAVTKIANRNLNGPLTAHKNGHFVIFLRPIKSTLKTTFFTNL